MSFPETDPRERDIAVPLPHRPGALARFAAVVGEAGVNLEGGGAWVDDGGGAGTAHFLVDDGARAEAALRAAGYDPVVSEAVATRLDQGRPGQLAALLARLADAGVDLIALYSDHGGRLMLVVDDRHRAAARRAVEASAPLDPRS
ncbi:hypothetical protein [Agromyces larvae]|uniref:ACT domain-containing protein n=1 Tax=Agromyces larvae TaxID=2929802 RepID=A0ABY4C2D4_9MICO|nr:hypothetical protein [Agromyces larvae]UOE45528.1 hypothetical protein MTO99_07160 [Agromyces larvae]